MPPPPQVLKFGKKPSGPFLFPYLTYIDIEANQKETLPYDLNINDVMAILNLKCRGFQP